MDLSTALASGLVAWLASVAGTRVLLGWLIRRGQMDNPNARSMHAAPKPRGAGPALVAALMAALVVGSALGAAPDRATLVLLAGAAALCALGWADDRRGLSARARLAIQALIVASCLVATPMEARLWDGLLPFWVERAGLFLAWLWMVNLTNFIDGIDGITGVQMATVGLGAAGVALVAGLAIPGLALALAGAGLGFLVWNWPPSRLFMGDSGSLPLGLVAGGVSIALALSGAVIPALLLNGLHGGDATLTLIRRALRGERVWQAHREHAYQRLARRLGGHRPALVRVIAGDGALVALALGAAAAPNLGPVCLVLGLGVILAFDRAAGPRQA